MQLGDEVVGRAGQIVAAQLEIGLGAESEVHLAEITTGLGTDLAYPAEQRLPGGPLVRRSRPGNGDACIPCPSAADPRRNPHHPGLVSEADFIAAQGAQRAARPGWPGGPLVPPGRAAALRDLRPAPGIGLVEPPAGLPVPSRLHQCHPPRLRPAQNTYVREDQVLPHLPHLAALAILHAGQGQAPARTGIAGVTAPGRTAELIDHLRAAGVTLIYDPVKRTVRTDTDDPLNLRGK